MDNVYSSHKFGDARTELIDTLSSVSEGYGSDSTGDSESPVGNIALVFLDDSCDLDFTDHTNYPRGDYAGELARTYGVTAADVTGSHIVTHDAQGFVAVETFDTAELAQSEYDCRAARYAEWSDEDRDDDGDGVYVCPVMGHGYHTL